MIRELLDEAASRFFLIQVEASGKLVCRWYDKTGDQNDNQEEEIGKITLPVHLKLSRTGNGIKGVHLDRWQGMGGAAENPLRAVWRKEPHRPLRSAPGGPVA